MLKINYKILFRLTITVVFVIYFIHKFVLPLYDSKLGWIPPRSIMTFEQRILCSTNIQHKVPTKQTNCPRNGIVSVVEGGRLGNQMWEYASVWAVSRKTGLAPYIPRCIRQNLDQFFDSLTLPTFDDILLCSVDFGQSVSSLELWHDNTNQSIILPRYVILSTLVISSLYEIVKEFSFKKTLLDKSQQILHSAAKNRTGSTFVSVHVRRTDYLGYLKKKYAVITADAMFFKRAMYYFESKYANIIFMVVSDDPKWCEEEFTEKDNVYITGINHINSPALDLAILASCNHSIFDYGTYGEWGALLAGGETIYYNLSRQHSSEQLGQLLNNWHTI